MDGNGTSPNKTKFLKSKISSMIDYLVSHFFTLRINFVNPITNRQETKRERN